MFKITMTEYFENMLYSHPKVDNFGKAISYDRYNGCFYFELIEIKE